MAHDVTGTLPNFSSANAVLPYLLENRNHLTMMQITHACAWALDPGFIQRDALAQFILSLPRASQQHQVVGDDEECMLCYNPYETDSSAAHAHFPIVLPCCWRIVGAPCLYESLKDSESCSLCRATIFTRPAAAAPPLADPASEEILRRLLKSGRVFLEKEDSMLLASGLGSGFDKSYGAFCRWAYGQSSNVQNIIARTLARGAIRKFELWSLTS